MLPKPVARLPARVSTVSCTDERDAVDGRAARRSACVNESSQASTRGDADIGGFQGAAPVSQGGPVPKGAGVTGLDAGAYYELFDPIVWQNGMPSSATALRQ